MTMLWQDLKCGLRMLKKSPGFTAVALVTLAIGIGANTVMLSISDMLLTLHAKGVKNPDRLAFCSLKAGEASWFRYSEYLILRDSHLAFSDLMAQGMSWYGRSTLVREGRSRNLVASYVSANYFSLLGVRPDQGRVFLAEEDLPGSAPVVVLSHRCWQKLGSDPRLVGDAVTINGTACQVVGVAPEGFTGADLYGPDLWLPLGSFKAVSLWSRNPKFPPADVEYPKVYVVGRLKPGLNMISAETQLKSLFPGFKPEWLQRNPTANPSIHLRPPGLYDIWLGDDQVDPILRLFSLILVIGSAMILVIACLNLANMLIVQGASRQREITVRMAVGGSRPRIIGQLLVESSLLALLGGGLGVALASWGTRLIGLWIAEAPDQFINSTFRPELSSRVLLATLGVCVIATLLFGLRPALWLTKRDIATEMKGIAAAALGPLRRRWRGLLVTGQVVLAFVLVMSAAMLTHSAVRVAWQDPRFPQENKLIVELDRSLGQDEQVRASQAYEALLDRLASMPEVRAVGASSRLFFGGGGSWTIHELGGGEGRSRRIIAQGAATVGVARDYFAAMEIPLLRGRTFSTADTAPNAEKVTVIDEVLARRLRPDGNALDGFVQWGDLSFSSEPYRVVGVVAHVPGIGERDLHGQMYEPLERSAMPTCLCLRLADRELADSLAGRISGEIYRSCPGFPVLSVATLAQRRHDDMSGWLARFCAYLGLGTGAAALFLATLGIYAVKGCMVATRTPEIGIRMALGATSGGITAMVLREGLVMTLAGLIAGLVLSLCVARILASLLYGVSPTDPISLGATLVLLGAASLLASLIPARRATKIDPMAALRCE